MTATGSGAASTVLGVAVENRRKGGLRLASDDRGPFTQTAGSLSLINGGGMTAGSPDNVPSGKTANFVVDSGSTALYVQIVPEPRVTALAAIGVVTEAALFVLARPAVSLDEQVAGQELAGTLLRLRPRPAFPACWTVSRPHCPYWCRCSRSACRRPGRWSGRWRRPLAAPIRRTSPCRASQHGEHQTF